MKMKIKPLPISESTEQIQTLDAEHHEVPFGGIAVELLADEGLRDTLARFFRPSCRPMHNKGKKESALWDLFYNMPSEGEMPRVSERFRADHPDMDVKLRIILDYPLTNHWYSDIKIKASRLGEIFGIAYDMYCHIYQLDDTEWQKQGHQDKAPSQGDLKRAEGKDGPFLLNRARGSYVWGHDMSDLVFESVGFSLNKKWPSIEQENMVVTTIDDGSPSKREFAKTKYTVPAPIGHKSADPEMPIGIISFFVGS